MEKFISIIILAVGIMFFSFEIFASATSNYVFDKGKENYGASHYYKAKQVVGGWTYESSTYSYGIDNYTLNIKDENQNIAIATLNEIKMTQDDDYFYFYYDIEYDANNVLYDSTKNIGNGELQAINNGELFLSNKIINNISYDFKTTQGGSSVYGSSLSYNIRKYYQSLDFKINNTYGGIQSIDITNNSSAIIDDNVDKPSSNLYCTLKFPFEDYFGANKISVDTSQWNPSANGSDYYFIFLHLRNSLLWTNGQTNKLMPTKLEYNPFISIVYNKDNAKEYWNNKVNGKIKIKKADINNYRYLNMYCPSGIITTKTDNFMSKTYPNYSENINFLVAKEGTNSTNWECVASKLTANSIISNTAIDLLEYSVCDHDWVYQYNSNKESHEVYCTKCAWNHFEPHNLEYEYDGIIHNACKCGYINKVHYSFEINDDENEVITETLDSFSSISKDIVPVKNGYKFKWFERYEKQFEDEYNIEFSETNTKLKTVFIATSSVITDNTGRYSTIYKVIYEPNHYVFRFSNENVLGLVLDGHLEDQVFDYGTKQAIKDNIKYENYGFIGWSLKATSSDIDFMPNQEILNYTDIDNNIFTLYPVYDVLKYKIVYSTVPGYFSNALKVMTKEYSIFDNVELEVPILDETKTWKDSSGATVTESYIFGSYTDSNKKEVKSMKEIKDFVKEKGMYYVIYLNVNYITKKTTIGGKNSSSSGGGGGSGTGYIKSIKTDQAIPINGEIVMKPGDIYDPNATDGNPIEIIVMDTKPEKLVSNSKEYKKLNTRNTNYSNNKNITKEAKEVIEEKFEPEVAEYILENEDAYKEVEETINEELGVYGMSLSPQEEFYQKYGVHIATTSYLVNYHLYSIKEATKMQKVLGFIGDHKIIFIPLFLFIIAGAGFYYYIVFWNNNEGKPKKRKKRGG